MQPNDAQATSPADSKPPSTHVAAPSPELDPVWTYRGYKLDHGDFTAAMVHLYRAEITRANSWRSRLDVTTNWALLATSAAVSIAFTNAEAHHSIILVNVLLVTVFLFVEGRRLRYYELWSYRVRLMETDFFAALLAPPFRPAPEWSQNLTASLKNPQFSISLLEAVGRRLRRNYVWIYLVLELAWLAKLLLYPQYIGGINELIARGRMGMIPGSVVMGTVIVFDLILIAIGLWTLRLRKVGEVL